MRLLFHCNNWLFLAGKLILPTLFVSAVTITVCSKSFAAGAFPLAAVNMLLAEKSRQTLQIDFSFYDTGGPGRQVAGYRLYRNGMPLCESGPVEPQSMLCEIRIKSGTYGFTLAAVYTDNSESPHSVPFAYTFP